MRPAESSTTREARPRLLLLGGGHAHVQVLAAMAREHWPEAALTLVSPFERQFYSGMLPGWMAGRFRAEDCVIPLRPWAERARARFLLGQAVALDAEARSVTVAHADGRREVLGYDLLSIDTGSEMHADVLPGAAAHGVFVRPLEHFLPAWRRLVDEASGRAAFHLAVVGSGAAGVELAMAARQALGPQAALTLVEGRRGLMPGFPDGVRQRVDRHLARLRIGRVTGGALGLDRGGVRLATSGLEAAAHLACDATLIATGGQAPRWLAGSGLALDAEGRIATGPCLQSLSHTAVFAAGDVASRPDRPHARSGVYAVRAGPPLARNLRRALAGEAALEGYTPQARALYLLACGDGTAIANRGRWSTEGRWVQAWKDHIDRGFIARWQPPPEDAAVAGA